MRARAALRPMWPDSSRKVAASSANTQPEEAPVSAGPPPVDGRSTGVAVAGSAVGDGVGVSVGAGV